MTAEPLSAEKAEAWGLIWKALTPETLIDEARELTERLSQGPTFGLAQAKRVISSAATNDLDQHLDLKAELMKACGEHPDYAEGVVAFLEKRKPVFCGNF